MAGEDQERFEDYLELERYIEKLQAGQAAHPPTDMTPEQASIYRMAALFRSAAPDAAMPHPDFAEQLKARLLAQESQTVQTAQTESQLDEITIPRLPAVPASAPRESGKSTKKPVRFVSRRTLLAGGAIAAAASFAAGVGIERIIGEQVEGAATSTPTGNTAATTQGSTIGLEGPTSWLLVTSLANLGNTAVRFVSDSIIGYVIRDYSAGHTNAPALIAMSAACTHMGCIVQWEQTDRQFHCPCHDALFTAQGEGVVHGRYTNPLPPLPRLNTKVVDGNVYVEVPAPKS